jgi:RimJ/RimL family protein N-acetyltransferase
MLAVLMPDPSHSYSPAATRLERSPCRRFVAATPEVFRHLIIPPFQTVADAEKYVAEALAAQATGAEVAFATVRQVDGRVVGTTRYLDIRRPHRGLEIGWTWITPEAHTAVTPRPNT